MPAVAPVSGETRNTSLPPGPAASTIPSDEDPDEYVRRSMASMRTHCEAIVALQDAGAVAVDYGNNLRGSIRRRTFRLSSLA